MNNRKVINKVLNSEHFNIDFISLKFKDMYEHFLNLSSRKQLNVVNDIYCNKRFNFPFPIIGKSEIFGYNYININCLDLYEENQVKKEKYNKKDYRKTVDNTRFFSNSIIFLKDDYLNSSKEDFNNILLEKVSKELFISFNKSFFKFIKDNNLYDFEEKTIRVLHSYFHDDCLTLRVRNYKEEEENFKMKKGSLIFEFDFIFELSCIDLF